MKSDFDLIDEVLRGEVNQFAVLVSRHQRSMMRLALRITRQLELAEDIVQESFLKAYQKLDKFEGRASFKSWLCQITLNTAKNRIRSLGREVLTEDDPVLIDQSDLDKELTHLHFQSFLQKEIEGLPEKQRIALSLRVFDGMSFKEIAEAMQCPYDTAKANYRHAVLKLKQKILRKEESVGWMDNYFSADLMSASAWEVKV